MVNVFFLLLLCCWKKFWKISVIHYMAGCFKAMFLNFYSLCYTFMDQRKKQKTKYKMECIIHYFVWKSYSKLKPVSSINEEAILKAKAIRQSIGGQSHHHQQCNSIPTPIDKEKHQLHRECYMKFTSVSSRTPWKRVKWESILDHEQDDSVSWKTPCYFWCLENSPAENYPTGNPSLSKSPAENSPSSNSPMVNSPEENFPMEKLPRILFSNYFCWKNVAPLKNLTFYLRERLT